jgi:hypothetical protein
LPPESGYCVKAELAPFVNLLVAYEGEAACLRGSTNGASASRCLLSECSVVSCNISQIAYKKRGR